MTTIEDPSRQISYLRQCLSSSKKPLGLFLGAGCPMAVRIGVGGSEPLIPDIAGITKCVSKALLQSQKCAPLYTLVEGHFATDGRGSYTVEDILTHVRALQSVAGKDAVRGLSAANL